MNKFLYYLLMIAVITGIYIGITALMGDDCDRCGDTIYGTRYHVKGTSDVICERCARFLK